MKIKRTKTDWNLGDIFGIKLNNQKYAIGHVLDQRLPNTIRIALYDEIIESIEGNDLQILCKDADLISLIEVTKEQIDFGVWKVIGNKVSNIPIQKFANEQYRHFDWVGSEVYDAAIAEDFMNSFYALLPWDDWYKPDLLDELLIDISKKPTHLIYKKK